MKYKFVSFSVEAFQFNRGNSKFPEWFLQDIFSLNPSITIEGKCLRIFSMGKSMLVGECDWIIRFDSGYYDVCKNFIFSQQYKPEQEMIDDITHSI